MITSGALRRPKRAQRSIIVRKFGHLSIPEILVITSPLTPARPPARPTIRPHHRHTDMNNSINRYGNPNATEVILEGNRHPRLVKQRQLKSQSRQKRKAEIVYVSVSSCPQIWNIELDKDREKEKVGGRPAKLNETKGNRDLEREITNKGDLFFVGKQT